MNKEFEDTIIIDYTDVLPGDDAPDPLAPEEFEKQQTAAQAQQAALPEPPAPHAPLTLHAPPAPLPLQSPSAPQPPPRATQASRPPLPQTIPFPPAAKLPPISIPIPAPAARTPSPPVAKAPPAAAAPAPPVLKAPPAAPPPPVIKAQPAAPPPPPVVKVQPAAPAPQKMAPHRAAPAQQPAPSAPPAAAAQPAARTTTANVIVLSADPSLIDLLRDSLAGSHRVWRADDIAHAADLMVAAGNAVFMVDASLADHDTHDLVTQIHKQFPELAIIVAGRREDEALLAPLVSSGAIFRFLHKPASAERIRNFVDATQRRANPPADLPAAAPRTVPATGTTGTHLALDPTHVDLPKLELPKFRLDPAVVRRWSRRSLLLVPVILAVWGLAEWKPWDRAAGPATDDAPEPAAIADAGQDARVQKLLDLAAVALSQGRLIEPAEDNALELYRAVLARDPGNRVAQRGIDSVADELLVQAERALMEQDLARLAGAVDAARSARPEHPRLEFFALQLQRERERQGLAPAARPGAATAAPPYTTAGAAQAPAAEDAAARVQSLVQLTNDRIRSNRLVGGNDSAHAHLLSARRLDAKDAGVQQATLTLSALLQKNAALATREGRLDEASNWLTQASALGVDTQEIAALRAGVETARAGNVRAERAKLLVLANQRIVQGSLVDPAGDSARHYIDLIRSADPAFDGLADTSSLFATRALTDARGLVAAGNAERAEVLLRAAADTGAPAAEVAAVTAEIAALRSARRPPARPSQVIADSTLRRTRFVAPTYPQRALDRNLEGFVTLEFTLAADGTTRDVVVKAAEPAGIFDRAAVNAVERWRYEPYTIDGAPVEPRVSTQLRFVIKE